MRQRKWDEVSQFNNKGVKISQFFKFPSIQTQFWSLSNISISKPTGSGLNLVATCSSSKRYQTSSFAQLFKTLCENVKFFFDLNCHLSNTH